MSHASLPAGTPDGFAQPDRPLRILVLGAGAGWHADQLRQAADDFASPGVQLEFGLYEELTSRLTGSRSSGIRCGDQAIENFDAVLTRTMPSGSMETITFRLSVLHAMVRHGIPVINPPAALEIAIDKYATLDRVARLGYPVPPTIVVQDRGEAMRAFETLGGDCVVKPLFGGEGKGVMRIQNADLAWTVFSTLQQIQSIAYIQAFVPPGGRDVRILVIGSRHIAVRRDSRHDFRTNASRGSTTSPTTANASWVQMARDIVTDIGLTIASVDLLIDDDDQVHVVEVNAIPGWRGTQTCHNAKIAAMMLQAAVDVAVQTKT
ncbi:ATP-grasp domain-containing protein [Crateriforma conspicua]|uniref:Alpha-aminoadipate--LysW ligase LysX n=1 Tax=Crateriforma conspicua TaxID=2527996 RepID=A0A5C5XYM6_9PLAN|nr:RimK family alpha-L-glutamate ligase [Crateriforma conspicua]QDV63237.1 Alpha-aminoadipate--LysW ligase LysX [Crateriforma conspicua]TWT67994.1 Alpha-aminoadipate--LysW ligase LysX [Crateriforma conspicua]